MALPPYPQLPPPSDPSANSQAQPQFYGDTSGFITRNGVQMIWSDAFRRYVPLNPSRTASNSSAKRAVEYQQQTSAEGIFWPIVYGEAIVPGRLLAWKITGSTLYLSVGWCLGEISSIVEIYESNKPLPASVTITNYLGTTSQTANATMAAQISGYVDTNVMTQAGVSVGISYTVFAFPATSTTTFPQLTARVRGMKANAGAWTNNPARCLADFISNSVYGQGKTVDSASVTAAADWCDEDLGGGVKRSTLGLVLDQPRRCEDWIEVMRNYALCYVVQSGSVVKLVPDKPGTSVRSVALDDMAPGSFTCSKRSLQQAPTVVTVRYTDTSKVPWREGRISAELPGVSDGTLPFRESVIDLPGAQSSSVAYRIAVQRLNALNLVDFDAQWIGLDEDLALEIGDIIDITHPYGPAAKLMRVMSIEPADRMGGRWRITAAEHTDAIYSDDIVETGSEPDTALPSPADPPAVDAVTMIEEIFTDQAGRVSSRFVVAWTGVDWPFALLYRVRITGTGLSDERTVMHLGAEEHTSASPSVKQNVTYMASVYTISSTGHKSPAATATATALGRLIPPGTVTGLAGFEAGQFVSLTWNPVVDIGAVFYRLRRAATSATWETAVGIVGAQHVGSTHFLDRAVPAGTWRYFIKAVDDAGLESVSASYVDIVVTEDVSANVLTQSLGVGTPSNMHVYGVDGDANYAITSAGHTWSGRFTTGSAWSAQTGTRWFEQHGLAAGDAAILSNVWDNGADRNGDWSFQANIEAIGAGAVASPRVRLATAAAYPTFTGYIGQTIAGVARYMQARVVDNSGVNTAGVRVRFPVDAQLRGKTVVQSGQASVPSSPQPLSVTFATPYAATPKVLITLVGTAARTIAKNNVSTTGFQLHAWDSGGSAAAATIDWEASGT